MSADDKALPKGALEEAASLFDELHTLIVLTSARSGGVEKVFHAQELAALTDLEARRAALEPRLKIVEHTAVAVRKIR